MGASGTVSSHLLYCFARGPIDLDGRDELWTTIDYFLAGDGDDPGRDTLRSHSLDAAAMHLGVEGSVGSSRVAFGDPNRCIFVPR